MDWKRLISNSSFFESVQKELEKDIEKILATFLKTADSYTVEKFALCYAEASTNFENFLLHKENFLPSNPYVVAQAHNRKADLDAIEARVLEALERRFNQYLEFLPQVKL